MRVELSEDFKAELRERPVDWGFGVLSETTFLRTYAWNKADLPHIYGEGAHGVESWADCCIRVVEATATRAHKHGYSRDTQFWQSMCAYMFGFKWSPSGRGLRMMGTKFIEERSGDPLFNCAFVSVKRGDVVEAFRWAFLMLSLGVGVGFDTGRRETLKEPKRSGLKWLVEDSREGWADALMMVHRAYRGEGLLFDGLDVSEVREEGAPVAGLGGRASGPAPLVKAFERLCWLHERVLRDGGVTDSAYYVDAFDIQAACIVSGGTRRSAQVALANPDDHAFASLKDDFNGTEAAWRWASNHSYVDPTHEDTARIAEHCKFNGEPGAVCLSMGRKYGRLCDPPNWKDRNAIGTNPCVEMNLEDREFCCVSEVNPARTASEFEFVRACQFSFLYGKVVTTYQSWCEKTREVQARNRRVGVGVTGVVQALQKHGEKDLTCWLDIGYGAIQDMDQDVSEAFGVPLSIKTTTVKPSGTVSLVMGTTPGAHFDHSPFYIRRVRYSRTSPLLPSLIAAGYHVEPDTYADNTMVVEFPVRTDTPQGKADATVWDKVHVAELLQKWWSDNMVSLTVDFGAHEADQIPVILDTVLGRSLKSISFLRRGEHGYPQAPYEEITPEKYEELVANLRPFVYDPDALRHETDDKFCDGQACEVKF